MSGIVWKCVHVREYRRGVTYGARGMKGECEEGEKVVATGNGDCEKGKGGDGLK
jgi:hypothetical protein